MQKFLRTWPPGVAHCLAKVPVFGTSCKTSSACALTQDARTFDARLWELSRGVFRYHHGKILGLMSGFDCFQVRSSLADTNIVREILARGGSGEELAMAHESIRTACTYAQKIAKLSAYVVDGTIAGHASA